MALSQLLSVNVAYLNGVIQAGSPAWGIDLDDIVGPVKASTLSGASSTIRYRQSGALSTSQSNAQGIVTYDVTQTLSQIALVAFDMVVLTVTRFGNIEQNATTITATTMLFRATQFQGALQPDGSGTKFFYNEGVGSPTFYRVSESLATIIGALPVGTVTSVNTATGAVVLTVVNSGTAGSLQWNGTELQIPEADTDTTGLLSDTDWNTFNDKFGGAAAPDNIPYVSAAGVLSDSWLAHDPTGVILDDTKVFRSVGGGAQFQFLAADSYLLTTDAGVQATARLFLDGTADSFTLATATGNASSDASLLALSHSILTSVRSGNAYADFDAAGSSVLITTDAGVGAESLMLINPTAARLYALADGSGVALTAGTTDALTFGIDHTANNFELGINPLFAKGIFIGGILDTITMGGETLFAASNASRASINIASGVAPTVPVNGDIWSDGTDLKMHIGGVTKTFTLL
jgi:hypothetical protein